MRSGDRVRWPNSHFDLEGGASRAAAWRTGTVTGVTARGKIAYVQQDGRTGMVVKRTGDLQVI